MPPFLWKASPKEFLHLASSETKIEPVHDIDYQRLYLDSAIGAICAGQRNFWDALIPSINIGGTKEKIEANAYILFMIWVSTSLRLKQSLEIILPRVPYKNRC
jgi:hypothetical protein